jgi:hypothetical protein
LLGAPGIAANRHRCSWATLIPHEPQQH